MRIVLFLLTIISVLYGNIIFVFADDLHLKLRVNSPIYVYNGVEKEMDRFTVPIIEKNTNRTIIPLEFIVEQLGLNYTKENDIYNIKKGNRSMKITIYDTTAYIDDYKVSILPNPIYINRRPYISLRFLAENFGFDVIWHNKEKIIELKTNDSSKTLVNTYLLDFEDEKLHIYYNVEIPVITGTSSSWFQKEVNNNILNKHLSKIENFLSSSRVNSFSYYYKIENNVTYCSNNIVSIMTVENERRRTGHSSFYSDLVSSTTIDFQAKKFLTLDDLFNKTDYYSDLYEVILELYGDDIEEYEPLLLLLEAGLAGESFNITDNGLMIYNFETFTRNYDDKFEYISIPFDKLTHLLKDTYLKN